MPQAFADDRRILERAAQVPGDDLIGLVGMGADMVDRRIPGATERPEFRLAIPAGRPPWLSRNRPAIPGRSEVSVRRWPCAASLAWLSQGSNVTTASTS